MTNHTIVAVECRDKYLQISLETDAILIVHLGMTGNPGIFPPTEVTFNRIKVLIGFNLPFGNE